MGSAPSRFLLDLWALIALIGAIVSVRIRNRAPRPLAIAAQCRIAQRTPIALACFRRSGEASMTHVATPLRAAFWGATVLAAVAAANAQTQTSSAVSAPAYPPTATITTPGYPAPGPADPSLRVLNMPGGKKVHALPATLETTQWGWFDNAQPPVLRVKSGDTII